MNINFWSEICEILMRNDTICIAGSQKANLTTSVCCMLKVELTFLSMLKVELTFPINHRHPMSVGERLAATLRYL